MAMKLKLMTYNIWGGKSFEEHLNGIPEAECKRDCAPVAEVIKNTSSPISVVSAG